MGKEEPLLEIRYLGILHIVKLTAWTAPLAVRHQLVFSDTEDTKEKDVYSDCEGSSMDGFIVNGSESDSEGSSSEEGSKGDDSSDTSKEDSSSDVDLDDVLSPLGRKKDTKKWQYKADMLASLAENPDVCLKAVCALYR